MTQQATLEDIYSQAKKRIESAQDQIELVQKWAEATQTKGVASIFEQCLQELSTAWIYLDKNEDLHRQLAQSLNAIRESDSQFFLDSVGGKTLYGDPSERSLKQYLLDTVAPFSNYTQEQKESRISAYLYSAVCFDLGQFNKGKTSTVAKWV